VRDDALCGSLAELADETWTHMDYGFNRGYGRPDERVFTDHHLIELCRRHPAQIRAAKFTQNREAETAADFEWFIGDGDGYLALRVQAKKLDLDRCIYPGLAARIGKSGKRQIDQLIEAAEGDGFTALYLFFNGPCPGLRLHDRCENRALDRIDRGCSVALATEVRRRLDERGPRLDVIAEVAWPWQCLTCCPLKDDAHPGQRVIDLLTAEAEPLARPGPSLTAQVPAYVQAVLATDPAEIGFLRDFSAGELPGTERVVTLTADQKGLD